MARRFIFGGSYTSFAYLLGLYPNATLGFSLRKLRSDYTGFCVRVRRSSDNATLDIGFVNNVIDTATLLSFVGAGSGFVTIWYNQATSNNATQTVAVYQPRIVNNGILETKNGKVSIYFSGNQWFDITTVEFTDTKFITMVGCKNSFSDNYALFGTDLAPNCVSIVNISSSFYVQKSTGYLQSNSSDNFTNQALLTVNSTAIDFGLFKNGVLVPSTFVGTSINTMVNKIGRYTQGSPFFTTGYLQEVVVYPNNQSANRAGIETNINDYYGIY